MSDCAACEKAIANQLSGEYAGGCSNCTARRIAKSPPALAALMGDASELRAAITANFKDYAAGRKLVWAWIERWKKGSAL